MIRPGDPVITTRAQGMLGQIPQGEFGIVREAGFFGDAVVEFMPGGVVRGISQRDLEIAVDRPFWANPMPAKPAPEEQDSVSGVSGGASSPALPATATGWALRLIAAVAILAACAVGITLM